MTTAIQVLLVEDSPSDADLLQQALQRIGDGRFELTWAESLGDAIARLKQQSFDVLLLDLSLPDSSGPDTFRRARAAAPRLPIVVLTGSATEEQGLAAVQEGVQDYLVKGETDGHQIARAIRYAIERGQVREQLRQQREWLRVTLASIGDAVIAADTEGRINFLNPAAESLTGWKAEDALGRPILEVFRAVNEYTHQPADDLIARVLAEKCVVRLANHTVLITMDGREVPIEDSAAPILDASGQVVGLIIVFHDVTERRQAQAALAAAHAQAVNEKNRLQAVMESLPVGVALIDAHGGNTGANPEFERVWGAPRPAVQSVADYAAYEATWAATGQPVRPEEWASARAVREGEAVVGQEMEIRRFDGSRAFVLNSAAPVRDESGRVAGSAVAIMDITERKRAEDRVRHQNAILEGINRIFSEALTAGSEEELGCSCLNVLERVTESRFGFIAEVSSQGRLDALAISDPGWDACRIDRAAGHRIVPVGFKIHGLYGRVILDEKGFFTNDVTSHPDSIGTPPGHPEVTAFLGVPLVHAGKTIGMIGLGNRKGGYRPEDLETTEALAPAIVQVFRDKRAEGERERLVEALRESATEADRNRSQLEAILQGMQDGVVVFDMQGRVVFVNEAEARIIGFIRSDAMGLEMPRLPNYIELFHLDGRVVPPDEWPLPRVLSGQSVTDWEVRAKRLDTGQEWIFNMSGEPVHDGAGKQILAVIITRDITEHRRTEERLRHSQKLESIGVLAGGIAHDFNNILVGVMGNASLAQPDAPPEVAARLDDILEATERAASLTRQLLAYAGKGQFEITDFELSSVIRSSARLMRVSMPKHVELIVDVPQDLPLIRGDAAQIQQVVMNLVINAAEAIAGDEKGTVSVRAGVKQVGPNEPSPPGFELAPGQYLWLEVSDTGCGMSEDTKAKIFDPFFTTKFTGRGLGLAAVQGILRAHKGAVSVDSKLGEGSTLTVYLPCVAGRKPKRQSKAVAAKRQHAATVLVVDDEADVCSFAKAALARLGHKVLVANNGHEAFEALRSEPGIDLVLLDIVMPVIGGANVLSEIRKRRPDIAVLAMSGYNREEARRLGSFPADLPFLEKPFTFHKLANAVQSVLERHSKAPR